MTISRTHFWWSMAAVLVMALSLAPSFAHLLEAPPRLTVWSPELWRETTVFNGQYLYFAIVGGPLDVGAIIVGAVVSFLYRDHRSAFRLALVATALYAASLATWFSVVAPANAVFATYLEGAATDGFEAVRNRWETGHIVMTGIKFLGLAAMVAAAMSLPRRGDGHEG